MSIQTKVNQLTDLNNEIKRLYKEIAKLKKITVTINKEITDYLVMNNEKGFRCGSTALVLDVQTKPMAKPKKSKEESYLQVIEQHGIDNPRMFLSSLMEAGKNNKEITKLKFHKI